MTPLKAYMAGKADGPTVVNLTWARLNRGGAAATVEEIKSRFLLADAIIGYIIADLEAK